MNTNPTQDVRVNGVTYRLQYRKCGKPGCKCAAGEGHGPYWYSYDGQSAAKYVGAKLPESVAKYAALLKSTQPKIKKIRRELETRRDNLFQQHRRVVQQLQALTALENSEHVDAGALIDLGLPQLVLKN